MSEQEVQPGLAVWIGLDTFGASVVRRLERWRPQSDDTSATGSATSTRLLPHIRISGDFDANSRGRAESVRQVSDAVGQLLSSPEARSATVSGRPDLLVANLWIVGDIDTPDFPQLSSWLKVICQYLQDQDVKFRVFLILRYQSWGMDDIYRRIAARSIRAVVDDVCAHGQPGEGRVTVFVVTDRDTVAAKHDGEYLEHVVSRFADMVHLGGVSYSNLGRLFASAAIPGEHPWNELPIFGSFMTSAIHWDDPIRRREANARARRETVFTALAEPSPRSLTPEVPKAPTIRLDEQLRWPSLRPPVWSPRFWSPARDEFADVERRLESWLAEARAWRHQMLVTHRDGKAYLEQQSVAVKAAYVADLDDRSRSLLLDQSIPGYFSPLFRLYDLAKVEIQVSSQDLPPREGHSGPVGPDRIRTPESALFESDANLISRLERKINPRLLLIVSAMTYTALLAWTIYTIQLVSKWSRPILPSGNASGIKGWLEGRAASWLPGVQDFLPSPLWTAIVAAIVLGLVVGGCVTISIYRQRVALEQAWRQVYRKANAWIEDTKSVLARDLKASELHHVHDSLEFALNETDRRIERLRKLEASVTVPPTRKSGPDPAITSTYPEHIDPPDPMTDQQIARTIADFRKKRSRDPGLLDAHDYVVEELMSLAAEATGDSRIDLTHQVQFDAGLRRAVMSSVPNDSAVHIPPIDPSLNTGEGRSLRTLAVPGPVTGLFGGIADGLVAEVNGVPVADRFYAATLRTEIDARRVFGRYAIGASEDDLKELLSQLPPASVQSPESSIHYELDTTSRPEQGDAFGSEPGSDEVSEQSVAAGDDGGQIGDLSDFDHAVARSHVPDPGLGELVVGESDDATPAPASTPEAQPAQEPVTKD